jgi:hypothetical protein
MGLTPMGPTPMGPTPMGPTPMDEDRSPLWTGAVWTVAASLAWLALALWRPTTTWHLAPVLVAGGWPWLVGRTAGLRFQLAGIAGAIAAMTMTLALAGLGLLRGPTVLTPTGAPIEAMVLVGATATLVLVIGTLRRRPGL